MKLFTLSLVCILSLTMIGCQRDEGVQAGREGGNTETYQPRPAPSDSGATGATGDTGMGNMGQSGQHSQGAQRGQMGNQELRGQVVRINSGDKTIVVRVQNGMEQTIKYDDMTMISGTGMDTNRSSQSQGTAGSQTQQNQQNIRNLKPGSEVVIMWTGDMANAKATSINVTSTASNSGTRSGTPNR